MTIAQDFAARGPWQMVMDITVKFEGAGLHIGAGSNLHVHTDNPLLRDPQGHPVLPASSIRGVLRNWCTREASSLGVSETALFRLWGPDTPHLASHDRQGRLTVVAHPLAVQHTEVRDHIRLDSRTETVAKGAKFDQEVALIQKARFELIYTGDSPADEELHLLKALKAALEAGMLSFGAKAGVGLGQIQSCQISTSVLSRKEPAGLACFLQQRLPQELATPPLKAEWEPPVKSLPACRHPKNMPLPLNWLYLKLRLDIHGPCLIGGPSRAEDDFVDHTYITRPDGTVYLPGSALRGVLQTQARRIANSLVPDHAADSILKTLFGQIKQEQGHKGLLKVGEGELSGDARAVILQHVAIDRISGFSAKNMLYNHRALDTPSFELSLRAFWRPECPEEQAAVALLFFLLRDLEAGLLWIGRKTTAGYGHIQNMAVQALKLSLLRTSQKTEKVYTRQPLISLEPTPPAGLNVADLAKEEAIKALLEAWQTWLKNPEQRTSA